MIQMIPVRFKTLVIVTICSMISSFFIGISSGIMFYNNNYLSSAFWGLIFIASIAFYIVVWHNYYKKLGYTISFSPIKPVTKRDNTAQVNNHDVFIPEFETDTLIGGKAIWDYPNSN